MKTEPQAPQAPQERIFKGLGVSPGIAIGPAHLSEAGAPTVPEFTIRKSQLEAEKARFRVAVERSSRQLRRLKSRALETHGAAGEELANLIDAYLQMLTGSRLVRGARDRIAAERINAEAAVRAELATIAEAFAGMDAP